VFGYRPKDVFLKRNATYYWVVIGTGPLELEA